MYKRQMLVGARLRHVAGTKWGSRRYLDMGHLQDWHGEYVDLGGLPGEATG